MYSSLSTSLNELHIVYVNTILPQPNPVVLYCCCTILTLPILVSRQCKQNTKSVLVLFPSMWNRSIWIPIHADKVILLEQLLQFYTYFLFLEDLNFQSVKFPYSFIIWFLTEEKLLPGDDMEQNPNNSEGELI